MFLLGLLFLNLNSCANIPDFPVCQELAMDRGHCVYAKSGKQIEINDLQKFENKTWWDQRNSMLRLPVSSWVMIKGHIIKMCKKYNCDKEITSWDKTIKNIDDLAVIPGATGATTE